MDGTGGEDIEHKRGIVPDKGSCFTIQKAINYKTEWDKAITRIRNSKADLSKIKLVSKEGK